jgi:hypothetical protein
MRETTTFDPGISTTFTTLDVRWKKDAVVATDPAPVKQTQAIGDPCHPDYVGGEECKPADAPTEPAPPAGPAGEATPTTPPARPPAG